MKTRHLSGNGVGMRLATKIDSRNGSKAQVKNIKRQSAIRELMDHPQYFHLQSKDRLNIVRRVQNGMSLSTIRYFLTVQYWVQTGLIFEEKGSKNSD